MRILYIDIDSLRPDHLGCYGYHRNTSPSIDALAREGVRFDHYFTSDAPCLPSRTAMYSGRFGIQSGVVGHGGTTATPKNEGIARGFRDSFGNTGLAISLQKLGLHTAMISTFGQRHSAHWFYAGFNEIHNAGLDGMESAEQVWPLIDRWFKSNASTDNWFLHINLWDPHTPYRVPLDYGEPFENDPLPAHLDDDELIARHMKLAGPHTALDLSMYSDAVSPRFPRQPGKIVDRASMRRVIDGFDTGVRYADDYIARIVQHLQQAGVYDDTAIILSADHGENLGELGIYAEHATADVATCRVPLIIKWPGVAGGGVAKALHYNLDLAPTLMDLLGGKSPAIWDGTSFAPTLQQGIDHGHAELVLSQCAHVCQRSVRFDRWLYMRTYHDGFHLFPDEMLFDLERDPFELDDVAATHPQVCDEGALRLHRWHETQMMRMPTPDRTDPLWTTMQEGGPFHARHGGVDSPLPAYLKRLGATGRGESAARLCAKYLDGANASAPA